MHESDVQISDDRPKRVLFGTSSWGLGHATRDLILLRALLDAGCEVTVVATGQALRVLRGELGEACDYLDWPDMPSTIARTTAGFYAKTVAFIPRILAMWFTERLRLRRLLREREIDLVISDHRYGMVTGDASSYFITHSPRYIAPWRDWFMEAAMETFVSRWLTPVRKVLIPDEPEGGLSGDMSHAARYIPTEKLVFLGFLSSIQKMDVERNVDLFISISGPEPQRTKLQEAILPQLPMLQKSGTAVPGGARIVVALGLPGEQPPPLPPGCENVELHAYLDRAAQQEMMNRAKLMVCRSGYTTLMELAQLGTPALLIPTPGQTEQLYLAKTLRERGLFHSVRQHKIDLPRDIERARGYPGYRASMTPRDSAQRFLETVLGGRGVEQTATTSSTQT